jgi:hypothetical protein
MTGCVFLLLMALGQFDQTNTGELRITVSDGAGLAVAAGVDLVSDANQLRQTLETNPQGVLVVKRLPFGHYRIVVTREGFTPFAGLVEIQSALPTEYHVTLRLAAIQAQVTVSAEDTLLDVRQTSSAHRLGAVTLDQRTTALPGRSLADLVNTQPGWLLEANGILHPRGSEYQTQYVVDGLPLTDNRSPVFAPEFGAHDVQSMNILTGGFPAEYGRKLGGVIEVVTDAPGQPGARGSAAASAGSFGTKSAEARGEYGWRATRLVASGSMAETDRYLDPPVEENYTNRGSTANAAFRAEHDPSAADRFGVIIRRGRANFLVPNEHAQQEAGQRQDRSSGESLGQFSYQRIFSRRVLGDVRGMARQISAGLWSNAASTPIVVQQDRGLRELYLKATLLAQVGAHEIKAGGDLDVTSVREHFGYRISDPDEFETGTPAAFSFDDRRRGRDRALFVQDQIRLDSWTISAGLRWDHYRLVVDERALSPRLAVAWSWPAADVVLRASYDRAFQTPSIENLLIASADAADTLHPDVVRLPVPPSRGNFYEAALAKVLFDRVRLDASYFSRQMSNVGDDDLLLNTGVSFPIAFEHGDIRGLEVKLDVPDWNKFSGFLSYSHLRGLGDLPVTGGLFLGEEGTELLQSNERFPISQDQRHTVRGRVSYRAVPSTWIALAAAYGSGLPFEDFDDDPDDAVEQFGARVVERVNFETGRVRPSLSVDASLGVTVAKARRRSVRLQAEVRNVPDRLDVINFAGLFSGTALAAPRSFAIRLRADF